ncbi:MAG: hypothetical protein K2W96_18510 [Gemmataceae bacterium]|nr:hypothetical protein [Gemmataceae bacterium]
MPTKPGIQLSWLKEAPSAGKPFIGMVVGWQTVVETINATVARFNDRYFKQEEGQEMKVIAAKQAVIAALKELAVALGNWRGKLAKAGHLSEESKRLWKSIEPVVRRVDQFKDVRNCAFHFGDFLSDPDDLAAMYEEIRDADLGMLNESLKALEGYGFRLRDDALAASEAVGP